MQVTEPVTVLISSLQAYCKIKAEIRNEFEWISHKKCTVKIRRILWKIDTFIKNVIFIYTTLKKTVDTQRNLKVSADYMLSKTALIGHPDLWKYDFNFNLAYSYPGTVYRISTKSIG